jgi:hypothetical protein
MDPRHAILIAVLGVTVVAGASSPAESLAEAERTPERVEAIFDTLVDRYRQLVDYEDTVAVVETVTRESQEPHRVETRLACRIENDRLRIDSPSAQVRGRVGLGTPVARSTAMESLALRYDLWIAPHLALRFKKDPLAEFRLGVPQGFIVSGVEKVSWRDRPFLKIRLKAAAVQDADADAATTAQYDLWVNPDSMLIERVIGQQRLPDGADYRLTMDITPIRADGEGSDQWSVISGQSDN